jgi:GTPase
MSLLKTDFIQPTHNTIQLAQQPHETEVGNKEYKRKICFEKNNEKIIEKRRTQMLYRLYEGNGLAFYFIGVEDNGEPQGIPIQDLRQTIHNLKKISDGLNVKWISFEIYNGIHINTFTAIVKLQMTNNISFSIL